jgi:hypothetical protein
MYNDNDSHIITFLRKLADSMESTKLPPDQLKCIGDFYMSYKFHEQRNGNTKNEDEDDEIEDMDIVKFLTLGWYVYKVILSDKNSKDTKV